MAYETGLSADETVGSPTALELLQAIDKRTASLRASMDAAELRWKWQTVVGVFGAVFAAVRLGIIAVPQIRERRRMGTLGLAGALPRINPTRRRR